MSERLTIYDLDEVRPVPRFVMMLLALLVGIIAGFGAVLFRFMIALIHNVAFLGKISLFYDANQHTVAHPYGAFIIVVPVLGAIVVAWLVSVFAPEAKGHGVPEVMSAIYYEKGRIRPMVALIKSLASAISIGTGGSVGREGPIVQIGSAFGSVVGTFINMPARQRCILVAAGAAGGISATFNTPVGALAFAIELMLVSVSAESVVPITVATVMATYIGRYYLGLAPAFNIPALRVPAYHLMNPACLAVFIVFGVMIGLASLLMVRGLYWFEDFFDKNIPGNYYVRHTLGMLLMGLIIYAFMRFSGHYYVQGVGYATIVDILNQTLANPALLLLLFAAKFLATGLTIGSGASGGIFSPSLFMGATLGAAVGCLAQMLMPSVGFSPEMFAIAGMAGMIGGCTGAIMTAIIMASEMTLDTHVILPVIITAGIAYGVRKYFSIESIYTLKLLRRGKILPEGLQAAITSAQRAQNIMTQGYELVTLTQLKDNLSQVLSHLKKDNILVILDESDDIVGVINKLHHDANTQHGVDVHTLINRRFLIVHKTACLPDVIRAMKTTEISCVIVMDDIGTTRGEDARGIITHREVFEASYQAAMLLH
jgi:CIC family chloride channel protein